MTGPSPEEFLPLPCYTWDSRPDRFPLDPDECATALFLAHGDVGAAAALLKVKPARFNRMVRRVYRLQRLVDWGREMV